MITAELCFVMNGFPRAKDNCCGIVATRYLPPCSTPMLPNTPASAEQPPPPSNPVRWRGPEAGFRRSSAQECGGSLLLLSSGADVDIVTEFARPIAVTVLGRFLGVAR